MIPLPIIIATALLVTGLGVAVVVVGWRARAVGPGVFYLLGIIGALLLAAAVAAALVGHR